jgi:tetratricopeptide (TPR) repeat protein
MANTPKSIAATTIVSLLFLIPLFYWTATPNFFATPKQLLIVVAALVLAVTYFINTIKTKTLSLPHAGLAYPLLAFMGAIIVNLVINPEGRPEALAGKATLLLTLPLISLLILTLKERGNVARTAVTVMIASTAVLALHTLLQLTVLSSLTFLPEFMQTRTFTLTGSIITTLALMVTGGVAATMSLKSGSSELRPLYVGTLLVTIVGAIATLALLLPGGDLTLNVIPYKETWSITLDALKSFRSMVTGVGLANFSLLYTAVKPLSLNLTPLWNTLPQTGTSELLTMLATAGAIGALALAWLLGKGYQLAKSATLSSPLSVMVLAAGLSLIFLPGTIPLYAIFFILLPLLDHRDPHVVELNKNTSLATGLFGLVIVAAGFAYALKPVISEYYMRQAQVALASGDGKAVYENHLKALDWYPSLTVYHLSYADVNLNLASALSQKGELTEADRATISQLISQSIREAKTAISLRGNYSLTWQTLGKIYRNLINVAEGADKFAVDYYGRAVSLDPGNPLLRVEYGGLFYQLGAAAKEEAVKKAYLARAQSEFQTAIQLRPTYANAYYNLAKLLETVGDYGNAYLTMQKVVANLDPASSEYASALSELEVLKTKVPKSAASPVPSATVSGELATPAPLPSPLPGGPLELPEDSPTP